MKRKMVQVSYVKYTNALQYKELASQLGAGVDERAG